MFTVSHIALFYLLGKGIKIKKLWIGMVTSILPDIALIIAGLGNMMGLGIAFGSSHPLNLFLHSIFALVILIPLIIFEKWYFYSATIGYSFHLVLDYLTHVSIRMPLYPFTTWKIPIFIIPYVDIRVIFITNIFICAMFMVLYLKKVIEIINKFLNYSKKGRAQVLTISYVVIISLIGLWYTYAVIGMEKSLLIILTIIITINLLFLGILFLVEVNNDEKVSKYLNCIKGKKDRGVE